MPAGVFKARNRRSPDDVKLKLDSSLLEFELRRANAFKRESYTGRFSCAKYILPETWEPRPVVAWQGRQSSLI